MIEIPRMLTMKEAARESGLSYNAVRKLCKERKIVYCKSGNKYYINANRLATYLNNGDGKDKKYEQFI